ncbi:hypothetical protein AB0O76_04665 [Streptomyces sp. NPDC086554]|uniref:hypothetical protein n=1 Tax=Streptomyces sp. NPDC086554 TaxID=3154864 RepID=UPI003430F571
MSSFAWFQDGVGYGAAELSTWQGLTHVRGSLKHVFRSTSEFLATPNLTNRTVAVGSGNVLIGGVTAGGTWAWSSGETLNVPTASNDNPRKDLIVARLTTAAVDGANGLAIELIQGAPAAAPTAPARPDNAVALCVVDVPKASTTFSITVTRHTGQYADQAALANGHLAIGWPNAQLPSAAGFPTGFTLYDVLTNQRWVRTNSGTWHTTDFGPWLTCTLLNFQNGDGVNVTTSGTLYVRESSVGWEFSGRVDFSPTFTASGLIASIASIPSSITRPTQHTYGTVGQTWGNTRSGNARVAYTTSGGFELGIDTSASALYVNVQLSKSPWNTAG